MPQYTKVNHLKDGLLVAVSPGKYYKEYCNDGQEVIVLTPDSLERKGKVCSIPFRLN